MINRFETHIYQPYNIPAHQRRYTALTSLSLRPSIYQADPFIRQSMQPDKINSNNIFN